MSGFIDTTIMVNEQEELIKYLETRKLVRLEQLALLKHTEGLLNFCTTAEYIDKKIKQVIK